MTQIHDMGGRFGDGPVRPWGEDEPKFHEEWHRRAMALTLATASLGRWNLDMSRFTRESLGVADYATYSYYEKWIGAVADLLVATGAVTRAELAGEGDGTPLPLANEALRKENVAAVLARGGPTTRDSNVAPRFEAGQQVKTLRPNANRLVEGGHTRLPTYAAGATGRILRCHGAHVLPDSNAHGLGEAPEPLYSVIFPASELWAAPEHPDDEVILDLWQSYLEPA